MPPDGLDLVEVVRSKCHAFMFVAGRRQELPTVQLVAMAQVKKRIYIIICYQVFFAGFGVEGEHDKENIIVEKPVLEMAVKRTDSRIILLWKRGALLEIKRKNREPVSSGLDLRRSTGEAQELKKLPAILLTIAIISEEGIDKIEFYRFGSRISR